ncbi:hypothetical protein [Methylocystis heyeri]|nr:hypothetical protein [Methylocystis heyeri]
MSKITQATAGDDKRMLAQSPSWSERAIVLAAVKGKAQAPAKGRP